MLIDKVQQLHNKRQSFIHQISTLNYPESNEQILNKLHNISNLAASTTLVGSEIQDMQTLLKEHRELLLQEIKQLEVKWFNEKGLVNLGLQYEPVTRVEELLQKIREIDEAILKLELLPKRLPTTPV